MSSVRRVFAEKKEAFSGSAKDLASEIRSYLGIRQVRQVRILIRYDIENIYSVKPAVGFLRSRR